MDSVVEEQQFETQWDDYSVDHAPGGLPAQRRERWSWGLGRASEKEWPGSRDFAQRRDLLSLAVYLFSFILLLRRPLKRLLFSFYFIHNMKRLTFEIQ